MRTDDLTHFLSLLVVAFLVGSCGPGEPDCKAFHKGEFSYSRQSDVRIVREESRQTEYSITDDFVDRFQVIWTDECSYQLILEETNRPADLDFTKEDTLFVTITASDANSYTYTAYKTGKSFEGQMIRVTP